MTLEQRAEAIADAADKCCARGGQWWQDIYELALKHLEEVKEDEWDSASEAYRYDLHRSLTPWSMQCVASGCTTSYAQEVYRRARQEVRDRGYIGASTYAALENLGHSATSIAGLERDAKETQMPTHKGVRLGEL